MQEQQVENTIPTDTGLAAIQKIANMIQNSNVPVSDIAGTGMSNIERGAAIAEKRV